LLREEVAEQLAMKSETLTSLAADSRKLLFPDATDEMFADGYAQAVTFGMLMARAKKIKLATGLQKVATELSHTSSVFDHAESMRGHLARAASNPKNTTDGCAFRPARA
jgi:hypothetical protein